MEETKEKDTKNNTENEIKDDAMEKVNTKTESKKTSLGLEENVEALLTYALGWVTGIIFLIIEKDNKFVKFHAIQSMIVFLGLTVVSLIFAPIPLIGWLFGWLLWAFSLILWIVCMFKAYKGEKFKLPIAGNFAEKYTK